MASSSQSCAPMDSAFEIGTQIFEAGARGNLQNLEGIREKYADRNLQQICDVYSDSAKGFRVLHKVAIAGYVEACEFLIKWFAADVNIPSFSGDTPLILAAEGEHIEVVECLLNHDALVSVPNNKGFTALHRAVQQDNLAIMDLLLERNAPTDINSVDGTVLQIAASRGNVKAVKLLLEKGAEPNSISTSAPTTPLLCSIKARSFDCMICLLEANADVGKFACGLTVLAYAAMLEDIKYLKHLLGVRGADANKKCTGGLKPIEYAATVLNFEAVLMLFEVTSPIETYPSWTILDIVKYNHSEETIEKRKIEMKQRLDQLENLGKTKMDEKDFAGAADLYGQAYYLDPDNTKWLSMRSRCNARAGRHVEALHDAEEVIEKNPQHCCPRPHHEAGVVGVPTQLFKRYHTASVAFHLSPSDNEIRDSYRVALSQYFSWLYRGSCAADLMNLFKSFP